MENGKLILCRLSILTDKIGEIKPIETRYLEV